MKVVEQPKGSDGCGLACIAMLADTSYEKVKDIAKEKLGWKKFNTDNGDLRKLAGEVNRELGTNIKLGRQIIYNPTMILPDLAILVIYYDPNKERWHWVVYNKNQCPPVLDPRHSKERGLECIKRRKKKTKSGIEEWKSGIEWFLPIQIGISPA